MNRLFAYGTLMTSEAREDLLSGATEVRRGWTVGHLYHLPYGYPALVDATDGRVWGQVIVHPDLEARLPRIDVYEGDLYERVRRTVTGDDGTPWECWCYLVAADRLPKLVEDGAERVDSGDWSDRTR